FSFPVNAFATTLLYLLSLHDALPILNITLTRPATRQMQHLIIIARHIYTHAKRTVQCKHIRTFIAILHRTSNGSIITEYTIGQRSEEHTSELQSRENLVCRLLLAKNK